MQRRGFPPSPGEHGDLLPPRRNPPTAVGAGEMPGSGKGYWEVWLHPMLQPFRLPGFCPERMVKAAAGQRGQYRYVSA
jgi:hypothetical protein